MPSCSQPPKAFGPHKMEPSVIPIYCAVCQQRAYGYNYDVVSCNACKMFFRRKQAEMMTEKCRFYGTCFEGDGLRERRPKCRPCRMNKCITVGMNRHAIHSSSESESSSDVQIISSQSSTNPSPKTSVVAVSKPLITQFHIDADLLKSLEALHSTRSTVFRVINIEEDPTFCDMVASHSKLGNFARPQQIDWALTKRKLKPWGSLGVMLVVEVMKTMDIYNELLLNDRVLLLKNVAFKSHHLSVAFDCYQRNKDRVYNPSDGEILPDVLFKLPTCRKVIMDFLAMPVKPLIDLKLTDKEFYMLNMIIICNPGIAGMTTSGQEVLAKHQRYYSRLLLDLCLLKSGNDGPSRFGKILAINEILEQQVGRTLQLDQVIRKHWDSSYYFPKILQEACRVEFTGSGLVPAKRY